MAESPAARAHGVRTIARPGETGRLGEDAAAEHLRRLGLEILGRNVRTAAGEIDLIAADRATIAFVEVKTTRARGSRHERANAEARLAHALERVGRRQRARLRGLALDWLREQPAMLRAGRELRFDAVAVVLDGRGRLLALEHLEGAW
ncbi:MAG TPA: YraN family protein [Solirubrobacteraceae bacterium]|nr:YraN family protein [Solirubrobacteraceae bacterium]